MLKSLPTDELLAGRCWGVPAASGATKRRRSWATAAFDNDGEPRSVAQIFALAAWNCIFGQPVSFAEFAEPSPKTTAPIRKWKQILCWPSLVRCRSFQRYAL